SPVMMPETQPADECARFSGFELDFRSGDLCKPDGSRVILPDQPFRILAILLKARGALVTREDLRRELWPENTFVDFEHSLNAGVKRLRESISDSATAPQFIETIPRRGYRFIPPVEIVAEPAGTSIEAKRRRGPGARLAIGGVVIVAAMAAGVWLGT